MKILVALMVAVVSLMASSPIVSGEWVSVNQKDESVVIVDVSGPEAYAKGHIPGAMNSPLNMWRMSADAHAQIRPAEALQAEMRRLGINNNSKVVVYSHHRNSKDILKATYVIWAMAYAGFHNTVLLDGGIGAYAKATGYLSKKAEADKKGNFTVKTVAARLAKIDEVKAALGRDAMVDSRPARFYFGAQRQGVIKRAGHISGAHSYFWRYNLKADNTLKPKAQLQTMLESGMGLDKSKPLIVYCTGGLEASMNYFVLYRLLGFDKAKLYDASMKEWGNLDDTPMTAYRWE